MVKILYLILEIPETISAAYIKRPIYTLAGGAQPVIKIKKNNNQRIERVIQKTTKTNKEQQRTTAKKESLKTGERAHIVLNSLRRNPAYRIKAKFEQ